MSKKNLFNLLKANRVCNFTTPSHGHSGYLIPELKKQLGRKFFQSDSSEQVGLDNLACPDGILKSTMEKTACIYGSKASFYLINGSTSGILAAMLSVLSDGDKVLVARNCHRAVYNGLVLTGATPIWLMNGQNQDWNIVLPLRASDIAIAIKKNTDAKALIITNPTYEGLITDILPIAELCKKHNIVLIVDEAHAGLWNFTNELPRPAIHCGADISVQSLHKTAGAVNPSAILHISNASAIAPKRIQNSLNLVNTSSPSYPILANIESCVDFLDSGQGKRELAKLLKHIDEFKKSVKNLANVEVFDCNNDKTKILLKVQGLSGHELSEILYNSYGIEDELSNSKSALFLTGIGTTKSKLNKLLKALKAITKTTYNTYNKITPVEHAGMPAPRVILTPRKAYARDSKRINTEDAIDKICAEAIAPYPPGIPVILPGEKIQKEHLAFVDSDSIEIISG